MTNAQDDETFPVARTGQQVAVPATPKNPREARMAAARARKRAAEDARRAANEERLEELEIARLEREAREEEALAEAERDHGIDSVKLVPGDVGSLIVKRPNHVIYKKFSDQDVTTEGCERLVRSCLVWPSADEVDELFTKQPALIIQAANSAAELAGLGAQKRLGKSRS